MKERNKTTAAALLAATLLATLTTAACHKSGEQPGQMSDSQAAKASKESNSLGAAIDDTGITARVKSRIAGDGRTKDADISVETNNGVVSLKGSVSNSDQKDAAEELARSTEGVKGVDDRLTSPSATDSLQKTADSAGSSAEHKLDQAGDTINDAWITTKVKTDIAADSQIKDAKISVTTNNGVVALSGTVPSRSVQSRAVTVARQVNGVKSVDDSAVTVAR